MGLDKWTTTPTPTQAKAYIGAPGVSHTFLFNPDTVAWDYQENTFSQDTLGGRVVQLLSVGLNGMAVQGRAGSRGELQRLAKNIKAIMNYQVRTLNPVDFKVPSRNWNFKVYIQAMPQVSWDVAATSYPYQLNLLVDEDLTGVKTKEINAEVLQRLASGIGHDTSKEIHGGDAVAFAEIVDMVTSAMTSATGVASAVAAPSGLGEAAIQAGSQHIGVHEDGSGSTMFSEWYGMPGQPWCAMFVTWCFVQAGSTLFQQGSRWASTDLMYADAQKPLDGMQIVTEPVRGDVVLFDWDYMSSPVDHVGIFLEGNAQNFRALEGNASDQVGEIDRTGSEVRAFVRISK